MNCKLVGFLGVAAITLMSCNTSDGTIESTQSENELSANQSSTSKDNTMKKHEDEHLSFEYPKSWDLKLLNLQSDFSKATQYSLNDENGHNIIQFTIDNPSSYTLGKASLDEFIEYNNPDKQEFLGKEAFKTATGEDVYYIVLKRTDDYHNDIRILIPGTDKYEINGTAHNHTAAYEQYVKNGDVIKVLKSIHINLK